MANKACEESGKPNTQEYAGNGKEEKIGEDLVVYIAQGKEDKPSKAIIFIYDIFGFGKPPKNGNVRRVCDYFAENGFCCVMPDFYRGKEWDANKHTPSDHPAEFGKWWQDVANSEQVKKDVDVVMKELEKRGIKKVGIIGTCWGGLQAFILAADGRFAACGAVHGARLTPELVEKSKCPLIILPAGNDEDVTPLKEVLEKKDFGSKCVYKRFPDEVHGFLAARGDWSTKTGEAAKEALKLSADFFKANL